MVDFNKYLKRNRGSRPELPVFSTRPVLDNPYPPVGVDFEGYYDKECSVSTLGVYAYTHHPKFDAYLVVITDRDQEYVGHPKDFDWPSLRGRILASHNRTFDYAVYLRLVELGLVEPATFDEWVCTADLSVYLKAGRPLKRAAKNLLGAEVSKDVRKKMLGLTPEAMAELKLVQKGRGTALVPYDGEGKTFFDEVCEYALSDGRLTQQIAEDYLDQWPEFERRLSLMTTRGCLKGFKIDRPALQKDVKVLQKVLQTARAAMPWAAGLAPDNDEGIQSIPQLKAAIEAMGLTPPSTTSEDSLELQEWEKAHPQCKLTVHMRDYRKAKILINRCQILLDRSDPEDRFAYSLRYGGAIKTLRWAGGSSDHTGGWGEKGFDVHNFPKEPLHGVDLRNRVIAPKGKKLIIADAAQIEPRCLAWCCNDTEKLRLMKTESVYQIHAVQSMGWDPAVQLKTADKSKYMLSKVRVLGLGYGCGHVKFRDFAASQYKYFMTLVESKRQVNDFRKKEVLIKKLWNRLQAEFQSSMGGNYEIELPSGRTLTYFDVQPNKHDWVARRELDGKFSKFYGGLLTENLIQATAREVFGFMLQNLEDEFGDVTLFHVHDEVILEVDHGVTAKEVEEVMSICPPWMPGLPVAAEAQESDFYCK